MKDQLQQLPCSLDAERFILGSLMAWRESLPTLDHLSREMFSTESNRRILTAIVDLNESGAHVDRVTVAENLRAKGELESVGGLTYLVSLDDGLPQIYNLEAYVAILREKAQLRRLAIAGQHVMNASLSGSESSAEITSWFQGQLETGLNGKRNGKVHTPLETIEAAGGLQRFCEPLKSRGGLLTPWSKLNEMTTGFYPGQLVVFAGNTSHGKTSAAMQFAFEVAKTGARVCVFSLEMSADELIRRAMCQAARVDSHRFRAGYMHGGERDRIRVAANDLTDCKNLWIGEAGYNTVTAIRGVVRQHRPHLVVVDYLQLMHALGRYANRHAELSEITRALKLMAGEESCVVLLLSQLNRDNIRQHRAPNPADLRESGSIEENADTIVFVWRPEMIHRDRADLAGCAEFIIAKQRNGPTGSINLVFLHYLTKFENRAEDIYDDLLGNRVGE